MEVEGACNNTFNKTFTLHLSDKMDKLLALDNNKEMFAVMSGTKKHKNFNHVHHASDKQMGFICHFVIATCLGIPILIQ